MPLIPPGDETGEYYIAVAGLPWNCSWQKLKDFARNQQPDGSYIEIDHAMVYPHNQTDGWVRVKGKESFLRAYAHLNGGELEHKALLADGRNGTGPIMLCDLGVVTSPSRRSRNDSTVSDYSASSGYQQYSGQSMQLNSPQETFSEWNQQTPSTYSPLSPVYSAGTYYQPSSPTYEAPLNTFAVKQPLEYLTAAPQPAIVYAGNMAPSTPIYMPQRQPVYACFPMAFDTGLMSPPNTVRSIQQLPTGTFSGPVVQTEARKAIIKGLPRDTSEAALINLVDQFCSHSSSSRSHRSYSSSIQNVDLARHSDGRLKGHAFIIFETHRTAKKAVDAINGHKFQGRELRATLAKEGVEPAEAVHQHQQQQQQELQQQQQHGYMAPEYKSESPSMTFVKLEERQGAALKDCMDTRSDVNGERSSKPNKGKEKAGESRSEDRGAKSRPKNKDPMRGTPAVVDGSGRRRH